MAVLLELFQFANNNTAGAFGKWLLISLYSIIFISIVVNKGSQEVKTSFIAAGTITAFSAMFLRLLSMIDNRTFLIAALSAVIPIIVTIFIKGSE